jgi:hypothetical protein
MTVEVKTQNAMQEAPLAKRTQDEAIAVWRYFRPNGME